MHLLKPVSERSVDLSFVLENLKPLVIYTPPKEDSSQGVNPMAALFIGDLDLKKVGPIRKIMVPEEHGL